MSTILGGLGAEAPVIKKFQSSTSICLDTSQRHILQLFARLSETTHVKVCPSSSQAVMENTALDCRMSFARAHPERSHSSEFETLYQRILHRTRDCPIAIKGKTLAGP